MTPRSLESLETLKLRRSHVLKHVADASSVGRTVLKCICGSSAALPRNDIWLVEYHIKVNRGCV